MSSSLSASFAQTTAKQITDPTSHKVISKGKLQKRVLFSELHDPNKQYALAIKDKIYDASGEKPKLGLIEKRYYAVLKVKQADGTEVFVKVNRQSMAKRLGIDAKSFKNEINVTNTVQTQIEKLKPKSIEIPEDIAKDWESATSGLKGEYEKAKSQSDSVNYDLGFNAADPNRKLMYSAKPLKK